MTSTTLLSDLTDFNWCIFRLGVSVLGAKYPRFYTCFNTCTSQQQIKQDNYKTMETYRPSSHCMCGNVVCVGDSANNFNKYQNSPTISW
jgi:hypothetical protein